jgi:hypothetical protein
MSLLIINESVDINELHSLIKRYINDLNLNLYVVQKTYFDCSELYVGSKDDYHSETECCIFSTQCDSSVVDVIKSLLILSNKCLKFNPDEE